MQFKRRIVEIVTIVAVMVFIVFLVRSCQDSTRADSEYQKSNYGFVGENIEDLIYDLCCEAGIDFDGAWAVCCPKCKMDVGAVYAKRSDGSGIVSNFLFVFREIKEIKPGEEVVIPLFGGDGSMVYCATCKYPYGYDWSLVDPNVFQERIRSYERDRKRIKNNR